MEYYLLTRDKIENIKAGTDSGETKMYGISVGVCLTIISILIPLYVAGLTNTRIISFLWVGLLAFAAFAYYLFGKDRKLKASRDNNFNDILTKSKTVVTLASPEVAQAANSKPQVVPSDSKRAE